MFARVKRFILGNPLANEMAVHERIPKWKALAVLSSDALSSVAYATEEILIPLAFFSTAAIAWSVPIGILITALLIIVTISYRQTIDAYPTGGGAYTVARENLGNVSSLVAGAALLIDYILTVAVSTAAGVENIVSAVPSLATHSVAIGVFVILFIAILNLRGIKDSSSIFAIPTYMFIFSFFFLTIVGIFKLCTGGIPPVAPLVHETYPAIPLFLILRAFASGCTALTGVEAISNGIPVFKDPAQKNAKVTLTWMALILGALFLSITILSHVLGISPREGETTVSLLARAVFGQTFCYYLIQASTALILILAANTSYADFPRLASLLARDRYLPRQLASLGDRLVFSNGIFGLSLAAILLLVFFGGDTHHLIPLYAVGVFLSFTLSQAGMIVHHLKLKEPGWRTSLVFNALGATTTAIVLAVITVTKFVHGAWMVVVLIPILVYAFLRIRRHYEATARQLNALTDRGYGKLVAEKHIAILPISGVHPGVVEAFRYALSIASDIRICTVELDPMATKRLEGEWKKLSDKIPLTVLSSPYRSVIAPIVNYIDSVAKDNNNAMITVVIPEFITARWYEQFLHNQTALLLHAFLRLQRSRVVTTSIRFYLR